MHPHTGIILSKISDKRKRKYDIYLRDFKKTKDFISGISG